MCVQCSDWECSQTRVFQQSPRKFETCGKRAFTVLVSSLCFAIHSWRITPRILKSLFGGFGLALQSEHSAGHLQIAIALVGYFERERHTMNLSIAHHTSSYYLWYLKFCQAFCIDVQPRPIGDFVEVSVDLFSQLMPDWVSVDCKVSCLPSTIWFNARVCYITHTFHVHHDVICFLASCGIILCHCVSPPRETSLLLHGFLVVF